MNCFVLVLPELSPDSKQDKQLLDEVISSVGYAESLSDDRRIIYFGRNISPFMSLITIKEEARYIRKRLAGYKDADSLPKVKDNCSILGSPFEGSNPIVKTARMIDEKRSHAYLLILPNLYAGYSELPVRIGLKTIQVVKRDEKMASILSWLFENRNPRREFEKNPKHKKNNRGKISPFNYTDAQGQYYLNRAVRISDKYFVAIDPTSNEFIHFRRHTRNHYHGYQTAGKPLKLDRELERLLNLIGTVSG